MDPQSVAFTPQRDGWKLSETLRAFQSTQQDHAERLGRLERRQDGDARVKSVWGPASPFPGLLGTPQNGASTFLTELTTGSQTHDFSSFDEDETPNSMVRSLHLDTNDEPRRFGPTSRANSVRFDESAKPGQWEHAPRGSVDLFPRASSSIGGHPLFERTASHKSDGRHSSAGQSVSGRANSLGIDATPLDGPTISPGMFILGTVPSIVRCWLNTDFTHDSMLYAAVCTGSHKSHVDLRLLEELGVTDQIRHDVSGNSKIRLAVYFPEATTAAPSSRSSSPAPQLSSATVAFNVAERETRAGIQVYLGSDMLQQHNGDVLFSANAVSLYDDERVKISIPMVRPENDEVFKGLCIVDSRGVSHKSPLTPALSNLEPSTTAASLALDANGDGDDLSESLGQPMTDEEEKESAPVSVDGAVEAEERLRPAPSRPVARPSLSSLSSLSTRESTDDTRPAPSQVPGVWSNWRRDGASSTATGGPGEWAARSASGYQRPRDGAGSGGIKVLKPSRQASRSSASAQTQPSPSTAPASRFFDDARRRPGPGIGGSTPDDGDATSPRDRERDRDRGRHRDMQRSTSASFKDKENGRQPAIGTTAAAGSEAPSAGAGPASAAGKQKPANPIGGASAFGWLAGPRK